MAAIDLNTVRSTIEGRLATELASSPAIPVVFNNMAFDSTTEDTFVQCLTSFGTGNYLTMGGSANSTNRVVISSVEFKIIQVTINEQNNTPVSFDLVLR